MIWAGSDDGLIHITRDDGETWTNVTPFFAPKWATVATIEASRFNAGTAYAVFDAHRLDDETPYIWKTTNYGTTWSSITDGLDSEIYLKVVREDTKKQGLLYLGTERGVMVSHDDGESWESLRLNMPTVSVVVWNSGKVFWPSMPKRLSTEVVTSPGSVSANPTARSSSASPPRPMTSQRTHDESSRPNGST